MNDVSTSKPGPAGLAKAVDQVGLSSIAGACGVSYQAVQKWLRKRRAPAERCLAIEQATDGKVTRYDLRPDVFGQPPAESGQGRH